MFDIGPLYWGGFLLMIAIFLALDLGVFHKEAKTLGAKEAVAWFSVWVALTAAFGGFVLWRFGQAKAAEFAAGYLLEESLSVDNIFVMVLIFRTFRVEPAFQHRVLVWGILGAVFLRAALILGGTALVTRFHFMNYVFGGFLVFTGVRLFFERDDDAQDAKDIEDGIVVRTLKRLIPMSTTFHGTRFFVKENGRTIATPLLLVLLTVELSDVIFALDSIPAIFGVTRDPFIVFTSNIFAILGLRTLFFLVSGMIDSFRFLQYGLAVILSFVGAKMIIAHWYEISIAISLGVIACVLAVSIIASKAFPERA